MTAFECFKLYLSLKNHFQSSSYDYFKYKGAIRANFVNFEKRSDTQTYLKVSQNRDPKTFLIGNFLFNEKNWVREFKETYQIEYNKFNGDGLYFFKEDLSKLRLEFNENFDIDEEIQIPYILDLYKRKEISFFTVCIFEHLLHMTNAWRKHPNSLLFNKDIEKISKSYKFFEVELPKYKATLLDKFKAI